VGIAGFFFWILGLESDDIYCRMREHLKGKTMSTKTVYARSSSGNVMWKEGGQWYIGQLIGEQSCIVKHCGGLLFIQAVWKKIYSFY